MVAVLGIGEGRGFLSARVGSPAGEAAGPWQRERPGWLCKVPSPEMLAEVVPEGHTDSLMKQCLNVDYGLTCQEEWKRSFPDPGKGKESGWSGEVAGAGRGLGSR